MSNCLHCGKTNPPSLGNKKRKYCSKKCANNHLYRKNKASIARPGWGDKSREEKRLKEERRKEFEEVINDGWVEYGVLAEQMNITRSGLWLRIKKVLQEGVETKKVHDGSPGKNGWKRYVHPDAIDKLKNPYPIPEGYLTSKQAAEYMGYSYETFQRYTKGLLNAKKGACDVRLEPSLTTVHKGSLAFLYSIDDLEKFKKNILEYREKTRQRATSEAIKERQRIKEEQNRLYAEQTANLICLGGCPPYFNVKSTSPIHRLLHEGKLPGQKIRNRWWFKPEDVEAVSNVYKEQKRIDAEKKKKRNAWKSAGHKYENANQRYEAKKQRQFQNDASKVALINKKYWEGEEKGIIHFFYCKRCGVGQPYYEFHVERTYRKGRKATCKTCMKEKNLKKSKKPKTLESKIRAIIGIGVKQHVSKMRGEYMEDLGLPVVWNKLEEHCGYNVKKLIKHIESQFVGEMSWENYGQAGTTIERGKFCWAIDHIKPKNSFYYTSLDDKDFIKCWSLENLRPLEWRINIIKSDKELRLNMNKSFRYGLKKGKIQGIWKILPYTPKEARKHLEEQFDKNMNWKNYGVYWQVDHIRPQASLPYSTTRCANFIKCWSLENLQPLPKKKNCAKTSIWGDVRWAYNDITD
jgi:hypothetical protein